MRGYRVWKRQPGGGAGTVVGGRPLPRSVRAPAAVVGFQPAVGAGGAPGLREDWEGARARYYPYKGRG